MHFNKVLFLIVVCVLLQKRLTTVLKAVMVYNFDEFAFSHALML